MSKFENITISQLLSTLENRQIEIPAIQRGFVWKPYQIENFWDSMLRGYPLGAFTVKYYGENNGLMEIIDGQQRTTAIALGFQNTLKNLKAKRDEYRIFIDLFCPQEGDNLLRQYIVKVITKYHPWGYRLERNNETLESRHRKGKSFTEFDFDIAYACPVDCYFPIPLDLFFKEDTVEVDEDEPVIRKINNYLKKHLSHLAPNIIEQIINNLKSGGDINILENDAFTLTKINLKKNKIVIYAVKNLLAALSTMLDTCFATIPIDMEKHEDLESIFERLNRGGTIITDEELNYSLFKSMVCGKLQGGNDKIIRFENSTHLIAREKLFPIMLKLFKFNEKHSVSPAVRIKNKEFKDTMFNNNSEIEKFLNFISSNEHIELLSEYGRTMLYSKDNKNGIPLPLLVKMHAEAPELMFMLLYRMLIKGDRFGGKNIMCEQAIILFTSLYWFYGRTVKKNYPTLLTYIFPCVEHLESDRFYSCETLQRASLNLDSSYEIPMKIDGDAYVLNNKDFLLYAQREALSYWFKDESFNAVDTNRPFDYDHIIPQKWIRQSKPHPTLYGIFNTNGNFRAWPFALNRHDHDAAPSEKFSNVLLDDNKVELQKVLDWSLCNAEWNKINNEYKEVVKWKEKRGRLKDMIDSIKQRNQYIYDSWNSLRGEEFLRCDKNTNFFHRNIVEDDEDNGSSIYYVFNKLNEGKYNFSIEYYAFDEDNPLSYLQDVFWLYLRKDFVNNIKLSEPWDSEVNGEYYYTSIQLLSLTSRGISEFIQKICKLLEAVDAQMGRDGVNLLNIFTKKVRTKYLSTKV